MANKLEYYTQIAFHLCNISTVIHILLILFFILLFFFYARLLKYTLQIKDLTVKWYLANILHTNLGK